MNPAVENTYLWKHSLARGNESKEYEDQKDRLRSVLFKFRDRVSILAARISSSVPQLTVHDVTHLDALWETADVLAGKSYPINAMEAFVLGGAILLHDAAQCFEAYEGGQGAVRATLEWRDSFAALKDSRPNEPLADLEAAADFSAVRLLHATQAIFLAERGWKDHDTGRDMFLIEDTEIRKRYGNLIGQIAASHNWDIEDVVSAFPSQKNASGELPADWRVDPVKVACLLRCADAAHMDDRRAPDFVHALLRRTGISLKHWKAQNWLARLDVDQSDPSGHTGIVTSTRAFSASDSGEWWVAYDAVELMDREIRSSNAVLLSRTEHASSSPPFQIQRIAGAGAPNELCRYIQVRDWKPTHAIIHVGNVEKLVETLGGHNLYGQGDSFAIVLRELMQNARDAIIARRALDSHYEGKITVELSSADHAHTRISVQDDGIGMSERVLTGPLLEFGTSFWATDLVRSEFPGLKASGFRSIGKFGIGFYSIFMLSSFVTVSSRRYDVGLKDVVQLRFPDGITLRPIVAVGQPTSFGSSISTAVTCLLPAAISDYKVMRIKSNTQNVPDTSVPLKNYLAVIVTGLDVRVDLTIEGEASSIVHRPIDTITNSGDMAAWLRDISFCECVGNREIGTYIDSNAHRLRAIRVGGRYVGLAALSQRMPAQVNENLSANTVGGLTPAIQRGTGGFIGYMDHTVGNAKRDTGPMVASTDELHIWAEEQIQLLAKQNLNEFEWHMVSNNMANMNIDPLPVLRAPFVLKGALRCLTLGEVFELMRSSPIAFFKMSHFEFSSIDQTNQTSQFESYPTYRPLTNGGTLLGLAMEGDEPKHPLSFIGCLHRYVSKVGAKLAYENRPQVSRSYFGFCDALLVSLAK